MPKILEYSQKQSENKRTQFKDMEIDELMKSLETLDLSFLPRTFEVIFYYKNELMLIILSYIYIYIYLLYFYI